MSRGQSQSRTQPGRTLERCKNKNNADNVIFIDVDKGKIDVVIVDAPESSRQRSRCSMATRQKGKFPSNGVISIDDEDCGDSESLRHADCDSSLLKFLHHASCDSHLSGELDTDECLMFVGKRKISSKISETVNFHSRSGSSRNIFGLNHHSETGATESDSFELDTSKGDMSDSDSFESESSESGSSDCEMEDYSGNIRQEWEKAALKRKMERGQVGLEECFGALGSFTDLGETTQGKVGMQNSGDNMDFSVQSEDTPVHSSPSTSSSRKDNLPTGMDTADWCTEDPSLKSKGKSSGSVTDHTVGKVIHDTPKFQEKEDLTSEKPFLHRAQPQDEATFYHKRSYPCDGAQFLHESAGLTDNRRQVPLEPACNTEGRHGHDANIISQDAGFELKDKSFYEESSISNSAPQDDTHNIGGEICPSKEGPVNGRPSLDNPKRDDGTPDRSYQLCTENADAIPEVPNDLIGDREKHKESDEYRHAAEEEWASRQRQLQVQAEEAKRLKKRKKAESLRLLEMAKRQKQRLDEMRESQKRDEETINLKEQLRAEVRKELDIMEVKYRDMASLLRGLGIHVDGGPYPMSCEVNAAYKQALLRFHPDRASRNNLRQQVEAEEKFKLISRLKEKLLPVF